MDNVSEKVSIIVPVYNSEKTLKKCLDSIINQTYKNIEIICINDGSKDLSLDILHEYEKKDTRIIVIDKENSGPSATRNEGIKICTGRYVTFVDSDDWLEPDTLNTILKCFKENVSIVRINYYTNFDDKEIIESGLEELGNRKYNKDDIENVLFKEILMGRIPSYSWLLTIDLNKIGKEICIYDEDVLYMEDIEFLIRILYSCENIFLLDKPLYHYYVNYNGMTKSKKNILKNMKSMLIVHKKLINLLRSNDEKNIKLRKIPDTLYLNSILNSVFISLKFKINYEETKQEFMKMISLEQIREMIKNVDFKLLSFHLRIPIFLVKNKMYKSLELYYKVRILFSRKMKNLGEINE